VNWPAAVAVWALTIVLAAILIVGWLIYEVACHTRALLTPVIDSADYAAVLGDTYTDWEDQ